MSDKPRDERDGGADGPMHCEECGYECWRDEVDVGVGIIYGPWGCSCGWSEDERYCHNPDTRFDSRGGFTPGPEPDATKTNDQR